MLLASSLLASCQNNIEKNENNNFNSNVSGNKDDNTSRSQALPRTERMSYQEYTEKYQAILNEQQNQISQEENNEKTNNTMLENTPSSDNMLATYSTPLQSSTDERINNLEIVCDRLNNFILKPKETFSYNNVTGPFGADDGFEKAPIMLKDGSKTDGYGGGVCQLSSTLYNVVKNLDHVEITERHHHSEPVSYVPEGEDATISLQSGLDFQFVNNADYPIQFKAKCAEGKVSVWAYKVL